ncbi:MAG: helix-turn-helix transcriptional regulator [Erysipelotrichaceae bacterium]|nr:helix-turn-helix transcriptional regulator [Erysipelotrichaceae bacterium]
MNTEFENEYYVPKTYAETAMEVIKNDWEDRKSKDCKKYTQERVAELMNISRIQFARALTQDKDPSITFICSYANAVGADIKELMMEIAVELDRTQRQTLAIARGPKKYIRKQDD